MGGRPATHPPADQPFVAMPFGDVEAAHRVARRWAHGRDATPPTLTSAAMNAVFSCGDVVVRVSRPSAPASTAYELADMLTAAGIRVARPEAGWPVVVETDGSVPPLVGTVWQRIVDIGGPADWTAVGRMVRLLHGLAPTAVPPGYPVPLCTVFPWWQFEDLLREVEPVVDRVAFSALADAVDRSHGWVEQSGGVERWVLCHGDVHPYNVIASSSGPVLIDWDLLCIGPPGWDHAPLRSMIERWDARPEWYQRFAEGYGADLSTEPVTEALTTLRLVAATLMRVKAGRDDPAAGNEAHRRLRYWRGETDAPRWLRA